MKTIYKNGAILLFSNDSVLLQLRDNKPNIFLPNKWCVLGGAVEVNETPKQAAIRELTEETGYKSNNPVYFMTSYVDTQKGIVKAYYYYDTYDNKQKIHCYEGQKIEFVPINKAINLLKNSTYKNFYSSLVQVAYDLYKSNYK